MIVPDIKRGSRLSDVDNADGKPEIRMQYSGKTFGVIDENGFSTGTSITKGFKSTIPLNIERTKAKLTYLYCTLLSIGLIAVIAWAIMEAV